MYAQTAADVRMRTPGRFMAAIYLGFLMMWVLVPAAGAFEVTTAVEPHGRTGAVAPVVLHPDSSHDDPCLYLLKSAARAQETSAALDREYREASGSALALGLVLGVRFALGPQEQVRPGQRVRPVAAFHVGGHQEGSQGLSALAIADYRACRNQHTLQALTD